MTELRLRAPSPGGKEYTDYARREYRVGVGKIGHQWLCDTTGVRRFPSFHRTWEAAMNRASEVLAEVQQ